MKAFSLGVSHEASSGTVFGQLDLCIISGFDRGGLTVGQDNVDEYPEENGEYSFCEDEPVYMVLTWDIYHLR